MGKNSDTPAKKSHSFKYFGISGPMRGILIILMFLLGLVPSFMFMPLISGEDLLLPENTVVDGVSVRELVDDREGADIQRISDIIRVIFIVFAIVPAPLFAYLGYRYLKIQ